jgi:hypothetical protein
MSNVGRHGSSRLSSKRRCISRCSRFAPMASLARAVRPLAAGAPPQSLQQVHVSARLGCPSYGGQRTARSVPANRLLTNARLFSYASPKEPSSRRPAHCSFSARGSLVCQRSFVLASESTPSRRECSLPFVLRSNHTARHAGGRFTQFRAKASSFLGAAVPLFFACRPTPPSSGQPSAAAHVER